jgi:hypothetical protein
MKKFQWRTRNTGTPNQKGSHFTLTPSHQRLSKLLPTVSKQGRSAYTDLNRTIVLSELRDGDTAMTLIHRLSEKFSGRFGNKTVFAILSQLQKQGQIVILKAPESESSVTKRSYKYDPRRDTIKLTSATKRRSTPLWARSPPKAFISKQPPMETELARSRTRKELGEYSQVG